ncbi:beta-lactamase family protein [Paraburkholderia sp. LEh10]|uniref:serine hydrolase domain-containing protein n=1 Tax=Paraburkholderia sp. LEh10 TaxID=2821353 RepID=UPI001AE4D0B3|nr:serine hydrolase domain-containing protein [Paraburkholderia sp. LEh10]MBP0593277.1 beta-lactamase family protein [Paraburkholderia sp. LEh10]
MSTQTVRSGDIVVHGYCAPEHERLREAFHKNFRDLGEVGASFAVTVHGELVADLWGGWKDIAATVPWEQNTIACIWSTSKGLGGVCFAMLIDRGLASFEDKISKYWPEFAANGKGELTIGMLLSHQSGITGFDTPATLEDMFAGEPSARRLAAQTPLWPIGTASGYSNVIGIIATELFKRIEGRSIQQFVAEELKGSFGLDISVGLLPEDRPRVASMLSEKKMDSRNAVPSLSEAQRGLQNPPLTSEVADTLEFQRADVIAMNAFSNARALASMYGLLLKPGKDGRTLAGSSAVAEASKVRIDGIDKVRGIRRPWAAGFLRNVDDCWGPNPQAFGHGGWGGSFGFADPAADVSVGYVMNMMSDQMDANPRRRALVDAVYAAI